MYINDFVDNINADVSLFADDTEGTLYFADDTEGTLYCCLR